MMYGGAKLQFLGEPGFLFVVAMVWEHKHERR